MKKIATLAEAYHVPLAPHCTASYLGIAASLHVVASIPAVPDPRVLPDEYRVQSEAHRCTWPVSIDADGYIGLAARAPAWAWRSTRKCWRKKPASRKSTSGRARS